MDEVTLVLCDIYVYSLQEVTPEKVSLITGVTSQAETCDTDKEAASEGFENVRTGFVRRNT